MPSGCMYLADTISKVAFKIMPLTSYRKKFCLVFFLY